MRSKARLFDEVAAAFQFPSYFGENWDALHECLGDLDWLFATSIIGIVDEGSAVLADEPPGELGTLVSILDAARQSLSTPIADGEWWDRPAVPLHWIVHAEPGGWDEAVARWTAAGAVVKPLPACV